MRLTMCCRSSRRRLTGRDGGPERLARSAPCACLCLILSSPGTGSLYVLGLPIVTEAVPGAVRCLERVTGRVDPRAGRGRGMGRIGIPLPLADVVQDSNPHTYGASGGLVRPASIQRRPSEIEMSVRDGAAATGEAPARIRASACGTRHKWQGGPQERRSNPSHPTLHDVSLPDITAPLCHCLRLAMVRQSRFASAAFATARSADSPTIGTNTNGQEAEGPHCITSAGEH